MILEVTTPNHHKVTPHLIDTQLLGKSERAQVVFLVDNTASWMLSCYDISQIEAGVMRQIRPMAIIDRRRDQYFMHQALSMAAQGAALGEVPVGAVLVQDGEIIGSGFNCPIIGNDPSSHAEMVAIRAAAKAISNYRLVGSTLYVTLEPCSMCAGLIVHSRVTRVVYGALEPKAGIVQSQGQFFTQGFLNHRVLFESGVLTEECSAMLSEFFKSRRSKLSSI